MEEWIGKVEDIGEDLIFKYREYLAECLETRVGELREKIDELRWKGDLELIEECKSIAESKAWKWVGYHWSGKVYGRVMDLVERYFEERKDWRI
jgi:hypothetical protein